MADRLKEFREKLGYNQQGLAEVAGIRQATWSRWEKEPPEQFEALVRLSRHYKVSADYLLGLVDDPAPATAEPLPPTVREVVALAAAWPEARQQELLDVALVMEAAERDADLREYDRIMGLLAAVAEGDIATEALETVLRAHAAGDRAEALRLVEAFFAGRDAREEPATSKRDAKPAA